VLSGLRYWLQGDFVSEGSSALPAIQALVESSEGADQVVFSPSVMSGGAMMPRQLANTTSIPESVSVGASTFGTGVLPDTASTRSWPDLICSVYSRTPEIVVPGPVFGPRWGVPAPTMGRSWGSAGRVTVRATGSPPLMRVVQTEVLGVWQGVAGW
jgi:hypothetical protein